MSMLAERKRKTKWVINPTKKPLWTTDSNGIKFSKRLMEKMGWSAGKGLGANEQGIQEPLKVSYKNDTKGMGFKGNDDDWIEHQDEFNCFLNQLQNSNESFVVKALDGEKNEVKSLEEKSKWSKARVHYQKFTRGKDLSKYSENDLACILGMNKTKNEKSKVEDVIQADSKIDNNMETHFGVTTINSGSIHDYFKKKWVFHKKTKFDEGDETAQNFSNENSNFSVHEDHNLEVKGQKKSKNKKPKLSFEECFETAMTPLLDDMEKLEEKKNKKKRKRELDFEEEIENKRKKKDFDTVNDVSEVATDLKINGKKGKKVLKIILENNDDCDDVSKMKSIFDVNIKEEKELKDQKKKKKKKDKEELKGKYQYCTENGVGSEEKEEVFEGKLILKKKKKCKEEKHLGNNGEDKVLCDISDSTNQSNAEASEFCLVVKKKKKKKENTEETEEKEEVKNFCSKNSNVDVVNIEDANETEISSELVSEKKQKKKKVKIEKSESESVANIIPSLEKENKKTSVTEVISEVELFEKKKKKEKKKDKSDRSDVNENQSINESISHSEVKLNRKKNKKKNKESEKVENMKNSESDMNNCLEEKKKVKKRHFTSENKPFKNKMKKSKKNKSFEIEDVELTETTGALNLNEKTFEITNQREFSPEAESVKKKNKKKKDKKEKSVEKEDIDFVDNNVIEIRNISNKKKKKKDKMKEISTEKSESHLKINNCDTEETNTQMVEQVKEKKIKNQEKNNFINHSSETKKSEDKIETKIEKADIVNDKKLGFNSNKRYKYDYDTNSTNFFLTSLGYSNNNNNNNYNSQFFNNGLLNHQNNSVLNLFNILYSYNYFNNLLNIRNWKADSENGAQNHKTEFLNDKKVDKFYPGQNQREKLLRLIHLSNFSEFKGSNLEKLAGYGFLKQKINDKPV